MNKKIYAMKLIPNRPDFAQTMTAEEREIMLQHADYWRDNMRKGIALVFGPVLDPKATYGLGIISVDDEAQIKEFIDNDPATAINQYEYYPMLAVLPEDVQ